MPPATPTRARVLEYKREDQQKLLGLPLRALRGGTEVWRGISVEAWAHVGFCITGVVSAVLINWGELHGMSNTQTLIEIFPSFVGPSFCCVFLFFQSSERRFDWRFWIILGCDLLGMVLLTTSISLAGSAIFFVTFR